MSAETGAEAGVQVRLAQSQADREAAFAVRRRVFVTEQSIPEELEFDDRDAAAEHFVALLDGVAAGAGRMTVTGLTPGAGPGQGRTGIGVLGRLAVDKTARGRGLGRLLVRAIEQRAAERGLAAVELHAQTRVRDFYQQLGYVPHGDLYVEDGIEHISMRKAL